MDEILVLNNVSKSFDGILAVKNVCISIKKGEVVGLIGPNGAGKTTVFNLITKTHQIKPDSGEILYNSHKINRLFDYQIARMGIGRLFQDIKIWGSLTVMENLLLAREDALKNNPMYRLLFPNRYREIKERNMKEAEKWLAFVNLEGYKTKKAKELSYGQQRLLGLARLLCNNFELLLLDEPTSGINTVMVQTILEKIQSLAQLGKTIFIVEHDMDVVKQITDRVYFMDNGEIIATGKPDEILKNPVVKETYLGA